MGSGFTKMPSLKTLKIQLWALCTGTPNTVYRYTAQKTQSCTWCTGTPIWVPVHSTQPRFGTMGYRYPMMGTGTPSPKPPDPKAVASKLVPATQLFSWGFRRTPKPTELHCKPEIHMSKTVSFRSAHPWSLGSNRSSELSTRKPAFSPKASASIRVHPMPIVTAKISLLS